MSPIALVMEVTAVLLVFGLLYYTIVSMLNLPEPWHMAVLILSLLGAIMLLLHFSGAIIW